MEQGFSGRSQSGPVQPKGKKEVFRFRKTIKLFTSLTIGADAAKASQGALAAAAILATVCPPTVVDHRFTSAPFKASRALAAVGEARAVDAEAAVFAVAANIF